MLHAKSSNYEHLKCVTCKANLKGRSKHCPNPTVIKHHFSKYGDVAFNIRDEDIITIMLTFRYYMSWRRPAWIPTGGKHANHNPGSEGVRK